MTATVHIVPQQLRPAPLSPRGQSGEAGASIGDGPQRSAVSAAGLATAGVARGACGWLGAAAAFALDVPWPGWACAGMPQASDIRTTRTVAANALAKTPDATTSVRRFELR